MRERELEKIFCRLLYVLLPESSFLMLSNVVYKYKLHIFISLLRSLYGPKMTGDCVARDSIQ